MPTTLRDFIANREGEIRDQLKALKGELKELQVAKAALDGQETTAAPTQSSGPTIKEMARFILGTNVARGGATSSDILAYIKLEFDREIDRTSLSPQLSRLKNDGEVVLEGEKWFSKDHWEAMRRDADNEIDLLIGGTPQGPEEEEEEDIPF